jgi:hypothetical protein
LRMACAAARGCTAFARTRSQMSRLSAMPAMAAAAARSGGGVRCDGRRGCALGQRRRWTVWCDAVVSLWQRQSGRRGCVTGRGGGCEGGDDAGVPSRHAARRRRRRCARAPPPYRRTHSAAMRSTRSVAAGTAALAPSCVRLRAGLGQQTRPDKSAEPWSAHEAGREMPSLAPMRSHSHSAARRAVLHVSAMDARAAPHAPLARAPPSQAHATA